MKPVTIQSKRRTDGDATNVQLCLAAGTLMAIETVLRDRIEEALEVDERRTTVEVPLEAMLVLAEFAEAGRNHVECHATPACRRIGEIVPQIMYEQGPPDVCHPLISALAKTV